VNGGILTGSRSAIEFAGSILLSAGTIKFSEPEVNPLGTASLTVAPTAPDSKIQIDPGGFTVLLQNFVTVQGGRLVVGNGTVFFDSGVLVKSNSEIDPANGAVIELDGVSDGGSNATLTLAGTGLTKLVGPLTGAVTVVAGEVRLGKTFTGTGSITLSGNESVLNSEIPTTFSGFISANEGTIQVSGKSPLGTGELNLGSPGQVVSVQVAAGGAMLANSDVVLDGTTVSVAPLVPTKANEFLLQVASPVRLDAPSTIDAPPGTNFVEFSGPITDLHPGDALTVENTTVLSGALSVPLIVGEGGAVALDSGFKGTGNITVSKGATLHSASNLAGFSGSITANGGTVGFSSAGANLGVGTLSLFASQIILHGAPVQLVNSSVAIHAGTVQVSGGPLTISAPVTMAQGSGIGTVPGTTVTFSGSMNGNLTVGGTGQVDLGGALLGDSVIDVVGGTVKLLRTFSGNPQNVKADGGKVD